MMETLCHKKNQRKLFWCNGCRRKKLAVNAIFNARMMLFAFYKVLILFRMV